MGSILFLIVPGSTVDIIITRFNQTPYITHGHHTASTILANKAFNLSGDPDAFPEQLDYVKVSSFDYEADADLWFEKGELKIALGVGKFQHWAKLVEVGISNAGTATEQLVGCFGIPTTQFSLNLISTLRKEP